ncbi:MAG: PmoA family protein, partial [Gemmataceae bacterium]|nr:PmoA family protein [Gemmataceae bacterium]
MKTCLRTSLLLSVFLVSAFANNAFAQSKTPTIVDREKEGKLDFKIGDKVVTTYNYGPTVAKPYFWPVVTLGENRVTRDWPML